MESGIPVLTQKGRDALRTAPADLSSLCRNILVQIDGNKSAEEILVMFRGLKGLEDALDRLYRGNYIQISRECKDLVKALAHQVLGATASTFIRKIDDIQAKYGDSCWKHVDELDKTARLFYGEVVADKLKTEIAKIINETNK